MRTEFWLESTTDEDYLREPKRLEVEDNMKVNK